MELIEIIGETNFYEKKERVERKKVDHWLKTISAFANKGGGILIFGISDNDEILGLSNAKEDLDFISRSIKDYIEPLVDYKLEIKEYKGLKYIVVSVEEGSSTPYFLVKDGKRKTFIRTGNETIEAKNSIYNYLTLKGINQTYDSLKSDVKITETTFIGLKHAFKSKTFTEITDKDLKSLGLVLNDGYLTNAGLLLCDESFLMQAKIICTRWNGLDKSNGLIEAIDDIELEGNLVKQLKDAIHFIKLNTSKKWRIGEIFRFEYPDYPERAIQEAMLMHWYIEIT
ncbi:AlbA family DNA-binding domain-containing protein [Mycoplasma procyoni]|uniref:AlbA family DNA-binding domain-containing protein n=1 Tax=Mycoplasma procyoni TaxID=568784 RepID=UPI00197BDB59|nr:RNA-binding domain-containing protein [Mycoplasma procyoni]MBN3534695.1 putative DNA binding domain-containing protein [Mycoplasma procyoni]